MIENDLHPPFVSVDKSVFHKTKEEKMAVKLARAVHKNTVLTIDVTKI
jgi:hypothetical protein